MISGGIEVNLLDFSNLHSSHNIDDFRGKEVNQLA